MIAWIESLRNMLVGEDPRDIERLWEKMLIGTYKAQGRAMSMAIAGVEIALWDILGKSAELPVCRLLGGVYRDKVRMYATLTRHKDPANMARRAAAAVENGFTAVKAQVSTRWGFDAKPDTTIESVRKIRKAIGNDVDLIVDANSAWTVPTAIRMCRELEPYRNGMRKIVCVLVLLGIAPVGAVDRGPVFPYGGVYFRKSNPPREDWERDYKTAAELGVNIMRHWFMWAVIEVAPGKYDWSDYDRQMDLAAQNGIKVVIGEISNTAPEWMGELCPAGHTVSGNNSVSQTSMSGSSATSSVGMCLDNEEVLHVAEKFQTALVERYRDHPALLAYDLWNEMHPYECYCEATQEKFREWLKNKYGSLEALGKAWNRYSMAKWEFVRPRRSRGGYADAMDWVEFRRDNKSRLLHRRVELFRRLDKNHLVTGHSAFVARAASLPVAYNDWRDAAEFDVFGFTYVASRNGNEPWMQFVGEEPDASAFRLMRLLFLEQSLRSRLGGDGGDWFEEIDSAAVHIVHGANDFDVS